MKVRILSAATRDLVDGYHFYERQAPGVGTYFLDSLYADIDSLIINAGIHPVYFGRYHRLLSKHFPFAVYYRVALFVSFASHHFGQTRSSSANY